MFPAAMGMPTMLPNVPVERVMRRRKSGCAGCPLSTNQVTPSCVESDTPFSKTAVVGKNSQIWFFQSLGYASRAFTSATPQSTYPGFPDAHAIKKLPDSSYSLKMVYLLLSLSSCKVLK